MSVPRKLKSLTHRRVSRIQVRLNATDPSGSSMSLRAEM